MTASQGIPHHNPTPPAPPPHPMPISRELKSLRVTVGGCAPASCNWLPGETRKSTRTNGRRETEDSDKCVSLRSAPSMACDHGMSSTAFERAECGVTGVGVEGEASLKSLTVCLSLIWSPSSSGLVFNNSIRASFFFFFFLMLLLTRSHRPVSMSLLFVLPSLAPSAPKPLSQRAFPCKGPTHRQHILSPRLYPSDRVKSIFKKTEGKGKTWEKSKQKQS